MEIKLCGDCKHCENKKTIATCQYAGIVSCDANWCRNYERKAVTNGDKVRQMSNAELAECFGFPCPPKVKKSCRPFNEECVNCWLAWLTAPAKDDEK